MSICLTSRHVAAGAFAVALAMNLGAQEPRRLAQPDSVPYDAAAALIGATSYGADPEVMIGGMPGWAAQRLYVPANARVLGSSFIGSNVTTVLSLPLANDSATMADIRAEFVRRGWTPPPPPTFAGYGGFRPAVLANSARQSPVRATLCSSDYYLTADVRRHAGTALYVTYHLFSGQSTPCHPPARPTPAGYVPQSYPTLYEPDAVGDALGSTACYPQASSSSGSTGTRFRTAMPRAQILEHFAKQLADSGWTRVRDSVPQPVSGVWTRPDSTGTPRILTLTISSPLGVSNTQCQEAQMNVMRQTKP